jgi:hypothetical protein
MAKISKFTVSNMTTVAADIDAALAAVGAKHGISIKTRNVMCAHDGQSGEFKLTTAIGDGKALKDMRLEKLSKELESAQKLYFPDLRLDATYRLQNGKAFIDVNIVGYNRKARKTPMVVQVVGTDTVYVVSGQDLREAPVV